jgi:hypothetical protein
MSTHTLKPVTVENILSAFTADAICAMTPAEAADAYPAVRDCLHEAYQGVGPSAARRHAHEQARLGSAAARAAGTRSADSYADRAAREAAAFADARTDYDRAVDAKHLLAIRAGNYDGRLPRIATPTTARDADIQRVANVRRAEID